MAKRIITSAITAPIAILILWLGGYALQVVVAMLILIGMHELYRAFNKKIVPVHFVGYAFALVYIAFIQTFMEGNGFFLFFTAFILAVLTVMVLFHKKVNATDCAVTVFGFFYVCVLLSTVFLVRTIESTYNPNLGVFMIWMIFFSAWGADTGAYFIGVNFGKHKLTSLSAKKTIEGVIGGIGTAALISAIYGLVLEQFTSLEGSLILPLALIGAAGAVLSVFGDLAASAVKRSTGIKDFGTLLPGHGGIMDRFDSVLFTAPAVFLLTSLILG